MDLAPRRVTHGAYREGDFQELARYEVKRPLIIVGDGAVHVRLLRLATHLDVIAEHPRHRVSLGKGEQPLEAGTHDRPGARGRYEEVPGVYGVSRQEHTGPPVMERDAGVVMAGDRDHIEHATSEVERRRVIRPVGEVPEVYHLFRREADHGFDAGSISDLGRSCTQDAAQLTHP